MSFRAQVISRLKADRSRTADEVLSLLERDSLQPVSSAPASITAHEALRLWKTRERTSLIESASPAIRTVRGIPELVTRLKTITPQKRVDQFDFLGKGLVVSVVFERGNGSFLGATVITEPPMRDDASRGQNNEPNDGSSARYQKSRDLPKQP